MPAPPGDNAVAMASIDEHGKQGAAGGAAAHGYFNNLLLHFRPATVPERTLRLSLTWGLGGAATVLAERIGERYFVLAHGLDQRV